MTTVEMLARKFIVLVFVVCFQTLWIDRTEKSLAYLYCRNEGGGSTRKAIKGTGLLRAQVDDLYRAYPKKNTRSLKNGLSFFLMHRIGLVEIKRLISF
jgi:hypothetical protein